MALRDAICRGDFNTTRTILSELGSKEEFIVNMAPNGSTTLLYWYKPQLFTICYSYYNFNVVFKYLFLLVLVKLVEKT